MIRAVLFDLGGTLHTGDMPRGRDIWFARRVLDRLADYGIAVGATPEELAEKLPLNSEIYKHHSEQTLRELSSVEIWNDYFLRDYHIGRDRIAPLAEELSFLYDYERPRVMRRPQLKETMELFKTSYTEGLNESDIDRYMDCVITSAETGIRKPDPEIFRVAERRLGLAPEELAYVGDTISRDVRGTRNAGWALMIRIRFPGTAHRDAGLENAGFEPDFTVNELYEIPAIIRSVNASSNGAALTRSNL